MTVKKYPSTPEQVATAQRRGWVKTPKGWKEPKDFTRFDQMRINVAEQRRVRRGKR